MRTLVLLCVLVVVTGICGTAEEVAPPVSRPEMVTVPTVVTPKETRVYKVVVTIAGRVPMQNAEPVQLDVAYSLKLQHKYGSRDSEGMMPLEVSLIEGQQTIAGETLALSRNDFPKLTVLLDRDWRIKMVYGVQGSPYERSKPGLNYVNILQLFFLYGGDKPHALGEKWEVKTTLPLYQETYGFANSIKAVEEVSATKAAVVEQEVTWTPRKEADIPYSTANAKVLSTFAVSNGKLLKSHADCSVSFWGFDDPSKGQQDRKATMANIKLDITIAD